MILSILLPYWGDVVYMKLAVKSVLEQTNGDWRLYILDDDYPGNEIEDYINALSDSRITYSRNPTNLGTNGNFRKALKLIETPYFMMFGADDILAANYVETIIKQVFTNPDVSMFQPGVDLINEEGDAVKTLVDSVKKMIRPKDGVHSGSRLAARLMIGNFTYFPSITWKTEVVQACGFRKDLHVTQDLALICDLLLADCKMLISSDQIFLYRRHAKSDSSLKILTGERFSEEINLCGSLGKSFRRKQWQLAFFAASARPSVRLHMFLLLPKSVTKPKIFLKTLKGALL